MKILNFPIIILTLCLILGILFEHFFAIDLTTTIVCLILSFLASTLLFLKSKNTISNSALFGISIYVCVFTIGVFNAKMYTNKQLNNHYKNQMVLNESTPKMIVFKIREVLKPSRYYDKYLIRVLQVDSCIVSGKVLLNVEKNTSNKLLTVDDIINVKTTFKNIQGPLNPNQFDYKSYLNKHHVFHQLHTKTSQLFLISNEKHTVLGYAAKIREYIQNKLKTASFSHDEFAIIEALFLGQRQNVSKDLFQTYSKAGVIHILAVSGLHVGIILLLLNTLLQPLIYVKNGRSIKTLLVVIILWCFAIVAGLSASVVRAITMFSIIALGMHLKRLKNIYNTLAISMFLLLSINPNFLFDIGFQLSYIAVISIVLFQPILFKLYYPKYLIDRFLWNIFTVSVAAQIGVLPLSVFYFHQFPGLFFISNLIIIPFLGVILGLGLVVLVISYMSILPLFLEGFYGDVISILNNVVAFVARQEKFLFSEISFSVIKMIFFYLFIILGFQLFLKFNTKRCFLFLGSILAFQCVFIIEKYTIAQKSELIVFHKSKNSIIGIRKGSSFELYHSMDSLQISSQKLLINYKVGENITSQNYHKLSNLMYYDKQVVLIIDKDGLYDIKELNNPIVLLRQSPKINLQRLVKKLKPAIIIADGSNYKNQILDRHHFQLILHCVHRDLFHDQ